MRFRSLAHNAVLFVTALWLVAACADSPMVADDERFAEARERFLLAHAALRSGLLTRSVLDDETLREYPLFPYLQAGLIERDLRETREPWSAADDEARAFLGGYDGEPVARNLQRVWLDSLARRGQWETFLAHYAPEGNDDTLRCQFLRGRIELRQTQGLEALAVQQWLSGRQLPADCEPVFQWLRERGALDAALTERRVRMLLGNGHAAFARIIARRLPQERAEPLLLWADLIETPQSTIDALIADPDTDVEPQALADGWMRLARNRPAAALERYAPLLSSRAIGGRERSQLTRALALGLAWDRRPEALEYFARVGAADMDDYALTWQARAALWAEDWVLAERSIEAMSAEERDHARWRYWAARAAEQLGDGRRAERLYDSVLANDNYYSAMAAARLGQPAEPNPEPLHFDDARLAELAARPEFVRARELLLTQLRPQAVLEWHHGFNPLDDDDRAQAIHLAARWGWHDVSVASATRQRVFNDYVLLYPQPFEAYVLEAAALADVEPELLYGVIRQESLFQTDAVSPAGALGVAQLMLETAQRTARRWSQPTPRRVDLFDPATNIVLAAAHLRDLADLFDGQTVVALAGYNAGSNAARRWLPEQRLDTDIWLENVPFNETREYVQRVLWHTVVFGWLRTGNGKNTSAWTAYVAPLEELEELEEGRLVADVSDGLALR
jgi:soluble lytic murein transglycosylase